MKILCASALILAFAASSGCKTQVAATVECKVSDGPKVECSILQTKGKAEIEVCWDFNVACANGSTLNATNHCGIVKDGGTKSVTIATSELVIEGNCEGDTTAEVVNVKLKAK